MLTLRPDPPAEGEPEDTPPTAWTVLSNGVPVGRAWRSRYADSYTLHIGEVTVVDTSIDNVLRQAQRRFGEPDTSPLPGWRHASDDDLPTSGERVLVHLSDDNSRTWVIASVNRATRGAVDVSFVTIVGGGRFQPSQVARYTYNAADIVRLA